MRFLVRALLWLIVLGLVGGGVGWYLAGREPGPAITITAPEGFVGQKGALAFTLDTPDGQLNAVEAHIEQNGQRTPLAPETGTWTELTHPPDGTSGQPRLEISVPLGKASQPTLVNGPATITVSPARPVFFGLRTASTTVTRDVQVRLDPPRVAVLSGCPIEQLVVSRPTEEVAASEEVTEVVEVTAEATEAANTTPTVTPTITLAPTATDSEIEIMGIISAGDVTAEGVRIRNNGRVVNVTGWGLSDADGNSYTFPDQMIFSNAELTLYTREGQDVPVSRYWGLETAVWQAGDVVTLSNEDGDVQAIYRVPANP